MLCIGHRGAAGHEPENTLLSIERALELGAQWVEVNVWCVEGRYLVVFHDTKLDRVTSAKGHILCQSFQYLRSLDVGKGQKIPTLEEVIDLLDGRAGLNIELKGPDTAEPVVRVVEQYIRKKNWSYEQFLISCFEPGQLIRVRSINPQIRIGVLLHLPPADLSRLQRWRPFSLNVYHRSVTRELVADAHRRGMLVYPYTVNEIEDIRRMHDLGVDGIITDYPERVR